jgi:uncharacterized membrane protein
METTLRDIRYGLRMLRKDLRFTIVAVVALMLAIASTTVIFSVINGVLLRPLPYPEADRLVTLSRRRFARRTLRATQLRPRTISIGPLRTMFSQQWQRRVAGREIWMKATRRNACA